MTLDEEDIQAIAERTRALIQDHITCPLGFDADLASSLKRIARAVEAGEARVMWWLTGLALMSMGISAVVMFSHRIKEAATWLLK